MSIQTTQITKNISIPVHDEHVLVIQRELLFSTQQAWQGMNTEGINEYIALIQQHQEFHPRSLMENDPRYKQVIPYLVFKYDDRYFLMQRKAKASEQRLQGKLTLGIGGHMRQEDLLQSKSLFDWARREFYEEIDYKGSFTIKPLGIVNDDSNEVGRVHIGLVLLLQGDTATISVREELEDGYLATKQECVLLNDRLESWSSILLPYLS